MTTARFGHTATLLLNGKVLLVGGKNTSTVFASADVYDPITGTFTPTGAMASARWAHSATLLSNGKVLIAGGSPYTGGGLLSSTSRSAELYDPVTGTFAQTGELLTVRSSQTATLLQDGRVLLVGGFSQTTSTGNFALASSELYDSASGTFSPAGSMIFKRWGNDATLLHDGKVLVTRGANTFVDFDIHITTFHSSAELYDSSTDAFATTTNAASAITEGASVLLPNGKVLVTGVIGGPEELYDPSSGVFSSTGTMGKNRLRHTLSLLSDGKVLVAGGILPELVGSHGVFFGPLVESAEIYNPTTAQFIYAGNLNVPRYAHTATRLPSGAVLVAGGLGSGGAVLAGAELFSLNGSLDPIPTPTLTSIPSATWPGIVVMSTLIVALFLWRQGRRKSYGDRARPC